MDTAEIAFQAPMIFRALCYLSAMGVFAAEIVWLFNRAYRDKNAGSLKECVTNWFMRILVACAFLSLAHMALGQREIPHISMIFPELSILCLIGALSLLPIKERPLPWSDIISKRLPGGLLTVFIALLTCCALWTLAFATGWVAVTLLSYFGLPLWMPFFLAGILWNTPLVFLYLKAVGQERLNGLKFHELLWPVLLAYLLVMLPDIAEHIGNHPRVLQMMDPSPPIVRV